MSTSLLGLPKASNALRNSPRPRPVRWSREEYYRLGSQGYFHNRRVERIRGEIVEISPIGWLHALTKTKVANCLRDTFEGLAWVNEQNPLSTNDSDPQPDVAVIPGQMKDYSDHPNTAFLIVEIADTSLEYDTIVKAEIYAEAGIKEYWVVDIEYRLVHVFRNPRMGKYESHAKLGPIETIIPLAAPKQTVRVDELLP